MGRPNRKVQKRKPSKRRNTRPRARRSANNTPSLGNLIAKGTTSLLSYLPGGEYLKPIADFAFRGFGWIKSPSLIPTTETLKIIGLGARFQVTYAAIALNSHLGISQGMSETVKKSYRTQFPEARLINLRITVKPISTQSLRQGQYACAFIPAYTDADARATKRAIPTFYDVQNTLGAVSKPVSSPIIINYAPNSPYTRDFHFLSEAIGICQIAFLDTARKDPINFTPDEFSIEALVTGTLQFRAPIMAGNTVEYKNFIIDMTPAATRIDSPTGVNYYDKHMKCIATYPDSLHLIPNYNREETDVNTSEFEELNFDSN